MKTIPEKLLETILHHTRSYEAAKRERDMERMRSIGDYLHGLQDGLALCIDPGLVRAVFRGARQIVETETPDGAFVPAANGGLHRVA
jgi:hypothetical protein